MLLLLEEHQDPETEEPTEGANDSSVGAEEADDDDEREEELRDIWQRIAMQYGVQYEPRKHQLEVLQAAMDGRDFIDVTGPGSGKTVAYLIAALYRGENTHRLLSRLLCRDRLADLSTSSSQQRRTSESSRRRTCSSSCGTRMRLRSYRGQSEFVKLRPLTWTWIPRMLLMMEMRAPGTVRATMTTPRRRTARPFVSPFLWKSPKLRCCRLRRPSVLSSALPRFYNDQVRILGRPAHSIPPPP